MKKVKLKNIKLDDVIVDCDGRIVGQWNGKSIKKLDKKMNRAMLKFDCMLQCDLLPHRKQIPADLAFILENYGCDIEIWGCDVRGYCFVSSDDECTGFVAHVDDIRCYLVSHYGFHLDVRHPDNYDLDAINTAHEKVAA